ncbi:hypothetical protein Glaag_4389 (plasmid) [Glaciecola sp. 4H-3-7+YE-5]|nr:hypothetical protein Glaag_4389 [Glaciecola sp. 4H-3-7+YE-5]
MLFIFLIYSCFLYGGGRPAIDTTDIMVLMNSDDCLEKKYFYSIRPTKSERFPQVQCRTDTFWLNYYSAYSDYVLHMNSGNYQRSARALGEIIALVNNHIVQRNPAKLIEQVSLLERMDNTPRSLNIMNVGDNFLFTLSGLNVQFLVDTAALYNSSNLVDGRDRLKVTSVTGNQSDAEYSFGIKGFFSKHPFFESRKNVLGLNFLNAYKKVEFGLQKSEVIVLPFFQNLGNLIISARIELASKAPINSKICVDTGSEKTFISKTLADSLGFSLIERETVFLTLETSIGVEHLRGYKLPSLKIFDKLLDDVLVIELKDRPQCDVIAGQDALAGSLSYIDWAKRTVGIVQNHCNRMPKDANKVCDS